MDRKKKKRHKMTFWTGVLALALTMFLALEGSSPQEGAVRCIGEAERPKLVPVGRAVGIKLFSHGVMVVGLEEVPTAEGAVSPAKESGLKVGDIITSLDGESVNTIEEMESILKACEGEPMAVTALRSGKQLNVTAEAAACLADGSYKLGAWVRDSMAGIGTVTFYDPATGHFCALGHGINDVDTNLLMPLKNGGIMASTVTGVIRGKAGAPGQLHGTFDMSGDLGTLTGNTACGVFGTLTDRDAFEGAPMPIAFRSEVETGPATILSNIDGDGVREYSVEILRIYPAASSETRNLMVQVTDPELLSATGGIVQGMSGSPILQNGKLVGAVTHVLVNDPTRGYGILSETMLNSMN